MFSVELDIYSGRRNPSWVLDAVEGSELIERLRAEPALIAAVDDPSLGLGYRGYIVSALADGGRWQRAGLPPRFRLIAKGGVDVEASASWLLGTREMELGESTERAAQDAIARSASAGAASEGDPPIARPSAPPGSCPRTYFASDTDFSFWNDSTQSFNNCYNFAANNRNNTFAQPGRLNGFTISSLSCGNVTTGVNLDGWRTTCATTPWNNLVVALVIAPGIDFHFYRRCASGHWCHKPGPSPATNRDNGGNWITNPQTANRGPYTDFCGYFMGRVGLESDLAMPVA